MNYIADELQCYILDQVKDKRPKAKDLPHTIQGDVLDYE